MALLVSCNLRCVWQQMRQSSAPVQGRVGSATAHGRTHSAGASSGGGGGGGASFSRQAGNPVITRDDPRAAAAVGGVTTQKIVSLSHLLHGFEQASYTFQCSGCRVRCDVTLEAAPWQSLLWFCVSCFTLCLSTDTLQQFWFCLTTGSVKDVFEHIACRCIEARSCIISSMSLGVMMLFSYYTCVFVH